MMVAMWDDMHDEEEIRKIYIYTDGSSLMGPGWPAKPATAGWGTVWLA